MLFEKSCGAVVIRKKDNVVETLIIQMLGGHWSFPKGHVENNETEITLCNLSIIGDIGNR